MHRPHDAFDVLDYRPVYTFRRIRRRSQAASARGYGVLVAAVIAVAAGIWYWHVSRSAPEAPTVDVAAVSAAAPEGTGPSFADSALADTADLPALGSSDAFVRPLARALSSHPEVAAWLATDGMIRRVAVVVVNVGAGYSPASHLDFMAPSADFTVREAGGRVVVDPASYRRYDALTEALVSLDPQGVARLYGRFRPLLDEAYRELGFPDGSFDDALARALGRLLAVPLPEGRIALEPSSAVYAFADPDLEALSPAAKHLLRFGPRNGARIQAKLRELAQAMGVEPRAPEPAR